MTPRSLRRAAERKAAKLARKQASTVEARFPQGTTRHATGPTSAEGKAISCLNHLKHGLTGDFRVMDYESQELFNELRAALHAEHSPATATETLLVDGLAEHAWLSQRAQRLGDQAVVDSNTTWFSLMLRYRTTHDRAFHKCLAELRTLRRERQQQFESQKDQFESQNAPDPTPKPKTASENTPARVIDWDFYLRRIKDREAKASEQLLEQAEPDVLDTGSQPEEILDPQ